VIPFDRGVPDQLLDPKRSKEMLRELKRKRLGSDYDSNLPTPTVSQATTTSSHLAGIWQPDEMITAESSLPSGKTCLAALTSEAKAILPDKKQPGTGATDVLDKYEQGMGQALAYLIQAHQICGTFLGSFLLGPTFLRMVMLDEGHIAVEVSDEIRQRYEGDRSCRMTVKDLLEVEVKAMTDHMPWSLLSPHNNGSSELEIDSVALNTFVDFRRSAVDLLLPLAVDSPLPRLNINAAHGNFRPIKHQILRRSIQMDTCEDKARRRIVAAARPKLKTWDLYKGRQEEAAVGREGVVLGEEVRSSEERSSEKEEAGEAGEGEKPKWKKKGTERYDGGQNMGSGGDGDSEDDGQGGDTGANAGHNGGGGGGHVGSYNRSGGEGVGKGEGDAGGKGKDGANPGGSSGASYSKPFAIAFPSA